ncbi:monooxygenase [Pseudoclavibacter sp. RFBJ3]|uniref:monooxygenase n=1 Tax=unclassified Pseudoclavibacter TaxID=2615177 RepID=UPI000CE8A964|nr:MULTISPECIES: monooxygenase [unclassified Pseudoclavibacter]MBF4551998.1 monooxygenase [Pseudoclavibacter sp. VKM Ac-2888]PPF76735.1 monooxygenase [Pseudoclavibacter sp. Z016]PPF85295.1 monooxygenase [Pseudoclavibacter sp. RFBJ5]PPF93310.1 monooxygenase [Pseudoclavibacter sp. RFBJ3]PPF98956.1 monooxygenase [Pseudoclavibacter sp. RFBH5]
MTVTTVHLWGTGSASAGLSLTAKTTLHLLGRRRPEGLRFARVMGTARATSFSSRDADLGHWALVAAWESLEAADAFDRGALVGAWDARSRERLRVRMRAIRSVGLWGGREPFGPAVAEAEEGQRVAVITRARIRASSVPRFTGTVPPIAAELLRARSRGLGLAFGMGELPAGLLGTFTLWESEPALRAFISGAPSHRAAMADSRAGGWFAEELFARFAVDAVEGWSATTA